ncbi:MAG: hypothetical protein Q8867_06960, partial [Bacteroidota bacterium]|nr:hypothetical protein [Bacteroidota bacterium]
FTGQPVVTVLTCAMLVASAIFSFRKNNYLFFTSLYTIVFLFSTFFIVNEYWGQYRFIIPCIPFAVLSLLTLFYFVLDMKQLAGIRWMFPVMICILFILSIKTLIPDIESARKIKNRYSGLTSDWEHYCRISEWAYSNLPKDALVACRKPSISFIYGHGKRFYGIMNVPSMSADSCLNNWQHNHLNYYLIQATSISNNPVSRDLYFAFKNSLVGYGFDNRELGTHDIKFYIMNFPDSIRARTLTELNRSGIEATSDYKVLKTILNEPGSKISIVYPDSLVLMLEKSKVTHILTANLQGYQTVERFMSYLEFKYPEIKTPVMQIGDNNDSPAFIYQLNYGVCKVK